MRYVIELMLTPAADRYEPVRRVLKKYDLEVPWRFPLAVRFEKSDPTREQVAQELRTLGYHPVSIFVPEFDPLEVERAELLRLYIRAECGQGFKDWAEDLDLPADTRVIDKRKMGRQDIAITYSFEAIISARLLSILSREGLTGWRAESVRHVDPPKDRFPPFYHVTSTNELPPVAPQTELYVSTHEQLPPEHPLHGTSSLFQRSPLYYKRADMDRLEDVNRTHEHFGEKPQSQPYFVLSQRAWRVFRRHKVRKVDVEPVIILNLR